MWSDLLPGAEEVFEETENFLKGFCGLLNVGLAEFGEHVVVEETEAGGKFGALLAVETLVEFDEDALSAGDGAAASKNFAAFEEEEALLDGLDGAFIEDAGELDGGSLFDALLLKTLFGFEVSLLANVGHHCG